MLNTFRNKHMKKVLWLLAGVIIIAFAIGGSSSLSGARKHTIGVIGNKKITDHDFRHYLKLAQVHRVFNLPLDIELTPQDIQGLAFELLLTAWKAKQEKITVSDAEVVEYIKHKFFGQEKFDPKIYRQTLARVSQHYNLRLSEKEFEESIRELIGNYKLLEKYVKVEVGETEGLVSQQIAQKIKFLTQIKEESGFNLILPE